MIHLALAGTILLSQPKKFPATLLTHTLSLPMTGLFVKPKPAASSDLRGLARALDNLGKQAQKPARSRRLTRAIHTAKIRRQHVSSHVAHAGVRRSYRPFRRHRRVVTVTYPDNINGWVAQASADLRAAGQPGLSGADVTAVKIIAQHESTDNPKAVNNWDSNAQAHNNSEGLMQTTKLTFAAYAIRGHRNILNPVDNIIAAVRYVRGNPNYGGSLERVPGVVAVNSGQAYVGY